MEAVEPEATADQPDSPVHGIDVLLPALSRQAHEGAAVRIQRWYCHRQAERKASIFLPEHLAGLADELVVMFNSRACTSATTYLSMFDQCLSVNQESLFPKQSLADSIHLVQAAQDDVKDYMQQRRQANKAAHLNQQTSEEAAGEAKAAAVAAGKAARAAAEKEVILKLVHSPAFSNWRN